MYYELRRYDAFMDTMAALKARFADHTVDLFDRHGFRQVGYFETVIGDSPELVYLLGWEGLDARQEAWEAFRSDPEWQEVRQKTTANGPLVSRTHSSILRPLPFSGLK